jgi:hypothetical protein
MDEKPFDAQELLDAIRQALEGKMKSMRTEKAGADLLLLVAEHPELDTTVLFMIEAADERVPVPTITTMVVIDTWKDVKDDPERVFELFSLNTRLMTSAVALVPLTADDLGVVLARRIPAEVFEPGEALEWVDNIAWEYANVSGMLDEKDDDSAPAS